MKRYVVTFVGFSAWSWPWWWSSTWTASSGTSRCARCEGRTRAAWPGTSRPTPGSASTSWRRSCGSRCRRPPAVS